MSVSPLANEAPDLTSYGSSAFASKRNQMVSAIALLPSGHSGCGSFVSLVAPLVSKLAAYGAART